MAPVDQSSGYLAGTSMTLQEFLCSGLPHPLKQQLNKPLPHATILISPAPRIERSKIRGMTTLLRHSLTFQWVLHFVSSFEDWSRIFNTIAGIVTMTMGHERPIEQSAPTLWAYDSFASSQTDFLLYSADDHPSLYRRADWATRPWGHDDVLSCGCMEPETSGGRARQWKVETLDPTKVLLKCTWCDSLQEWSRPKHLRGAALVCALPTKIGSTYFVKWPFGWCPGLSGV
ncbi:hypothetical protein CTheo_8369 [Ceratobasidium theobromae]|uniref:Uncharacterized protein n=1 Tax=Ceratobasidium theobromae TaxID=1582974 RepID=A0A5N5Q992_9AGAM|nr:hypothetical protein CTheo_8369 [Ceratobasidium theobromae]